MGERDSDADLSIEGLPEELEGEMESFPSRKILAKKETDADEPPSYFARWFETVSPDKVIREDEYFWHTGQALDPDFWTSEEKLDAYLGMNEPHKPLWANEDEHTGASFPLSLSLDF